MDSAFEVNTVLPAIFFSEWSPQTETMTGGCEGWVCVRWNSSRLRSISSICVPFALMCAGASVGQVAGGNKHGRVGGYSGDDTAAEGGGRLRIHRRPAVASR